MWHQESRDGSYIAPSSVPFLSGASSPPRNHLSHIPQGHPTAAHVDGELERRLIGGGEDGSFTFSGGVGLGDLNHPVMPPFMGSFPSSSCVLSDTAVVQETSDFSMPQRRESLSPAFTSTTRIMEETVVFRSSTSSSSATSNSTLSDTSRPGSMINMLSSPVPAEAAGSLLLEAIDPTTTTTMESESLIARISIPESHRPMFINVLSNPPDLSLKIKKKAVRFNQDVLESNASVSSSKALRSPPLSGIAGNTIIHSKAQSLSSADNRDPEEKMAELMELKQMKIRQEDFLHLKDQILHVSQDLEDKENILDEVRSERKVLQSELSRYISMARQVQKDLELAQQAEAQLNNERDQLSQQLNQLKHHDFKILKEEVDQLRTKKGLHALPSLEQEEAERMGRYLEQRRGQWREDGISDDGGVGPSSSSSSSSSHRHGTAATTETFTSQSSHTASGSRSSTLSAPFTMTTRARDHNNTGTSYNHNLSGRSRHSGSVSNNNNNNSNQGTIKSRYESSRRSSRSRTPGGSISSAASTRQSRSRSPGPKKRSRC